MSTQDNLILLIQNSILMSQIDTPSLFTLARDDVHNTALHREFFTQMDCSQPFNLHADITSITDVRVVRWKWQMPAPVGGIKTYAVIAPSDAEGQRAD